MREITAKLGNMRKAVSWVVYPKTYSNNDNFYIQSDHRFCRFDPKTGIGILGKHTTNSSSVDLMMPGAITISIPKKVIDDVISCQPKSGQSIGGGVFVA